MDLLGSSVVGVADLAAWATAIANRSRIIFTVQCDVIAQMLYFIFPFLLVLLR